MLPRKRALWDDRDFYTGNNECFPNADTSKQTVAFKKKTFQVLHHLLFDIIIMINKWRDSHVQKSSALKTDLD